uniref:Uncharacterized protein n=1 Tax=Timema shepardi TaxID=629360 RepID=A0A7R9AM86_TIMSH|nr:unnamed protein product [Timema shepardi]
MRLTALCQIGPQNCVDVGNTGVGGGGTIYIRQQTNKQTTRPTPSRGPGLLPPVAPLQRLKGPHVNALALTNGLYLRMRELCDAANGRGGSLAGIGGMPGLIQIVSNTRARLDGRGSNFENGIRKWKYQVAGRALEGTFTLEGLSEALEGTFTLEGLSEALEETFTLEGLSEAIEGTFTLEGLSEALEGTLTLEGQSEALEGTLTLEGQSLLRPGKFTHVQRICRTPISMTTRIATECSVERASAASNPSKRRPRTLKSKAKLGLTSDKCFLSRTDVLCSKPHLSHAPLREMSGFNTDLARGSRCPSAPPVESLLLGYLFSGYTLLPRHKRNNRIGQHRSLRERESERARERCSERAASVILGVTGMVTTRDSVLLLSGEYETRGGHPRPTSPTLVRLRGKVSDFCAGGPGFNPRLVESLKSKLGKVNEEVEHIEAVEVDIEQAHRKLQELQKEVRGLYVFGEDVDAAESDLQSLKGRVDSSISQAKTLVSETKDHYIGLQQLVPTDIAQQFRATIRVIYWSVVVVQLSSLELLWETVSGAMEEKSRDLKRARTVRSEYNADVDEVQSWLQRAEAQVQDRSVDPHQQKEYLMKFQGELGSVDDRLERLTKNGGVLIGNSRDDGEKALVQSTINTLTERLQQFRSCLEQKKHQVGDTLDSWQRFMTMYQAVKSWVDEKQTFLVEPLHLSSLTQARQKVHDYSTAVKTCKQMTKNLSDMSKELESIGQVNSVGDLPEKLEEAEEAKGEVEAQLLERIFDKLDKRGSTLYSSPRASLVLTDSVEKLPDQVTYHYAKSNDLQKHNGLLLETSEEWEQCEKKMKDVRAWMDKSRQSLESPQNKKKPLRDQLTMRDKMVMDVATQKTKISISAEKLQVHFRSGVGGDSKVTEAAQEILKELDQFHEVVKEQSNTLDTCLLQLDQYQQEIQQLRQQIVQVESQLRIVLSPTYLPHERDRAAEEQNVCRERVVALQTKIAARNERMKLLAQRGTPDTEPLDS